MPRTLIKFTTHIINEGILSEYKKCQDIDGYDTILMLDNSGNKFSSDTENHIQELEFYGEKYKCFLFDSNLHDALKLPYYNKHNDNLFKNTLWYNADYQFYYLKRFFPDYDYYWHIEYDVFCNGNSYKPFLDKYQDKNEDLLILHLENVLLNSEWYWSNKCNWIYDEKTNFHKSFFPIVRLSSNAINFLYKKRLEHAEIYSNLKNKEDNSWIFVEAFVPTELLNNGFTALNIDEPARYEPEYDLNSERLFEHPDNRLYHPVKGNFLYRLKMLEYENIELKNQIKELSHFTIPFMGFKIRIKQKLKRK